MCVRIVFIPILSVQLALKEAEQQYTALALAVSNKNVVEAKSLANQYVEVVHVYTGVISHGFLAIGRV